jgi:hypothetical protein
MKKISHAEFQLHVRTQTKKKRKCLGCGKEFLSESAGHRVCSVCVDKNEKLSFRCETLGA